MINLGKFLKKRKGGKMSTDKKLSDVVAGKYKSTKQKDSCRKKAMIKASARYMKKSKK